MDFGYAGNVVANVLITRRKQSGSFVLDYRSKQSVPKGIERYLLDLLIREDHA